jgi:hypothetical protein
MVTIRLRGFPCFLLAGDLEGNVPMGSPLLFGHFPKCRCYSVSIAEKVSNPLWAFPKESAIPFRFCSIISKSIGIDLGISFTFPSKQPVSVY